MACEGTPSSIMKLKSTWIFVIWTAYCHIGSQRERVPTQVWVEWPGSEEDVEGTRPSQTQMWSSLGQAEGGFQINVCFSLPIYVYLNTLCFFWCCMICWAASNKYQVSFLCFYPQSIWKAMLVEVPNLVSIINGHVRYVGVIHVFSPMVFNFYQLVIHNKIYCCIGKSTEKHRRMSYWKWSLPWLKYGLIIAYLLFP